jgi:CRISPR-associated protein Cas2
MPRLWLVTYDIACPRRRYRLDRLLGGLGFRVLESLWECRLRADQIPGLTHKLRQLLHPDEDQCALIPLCADCQRRTLRLGTPQQPGLCPHGAWIF